MCSVRITEAGCGVLNWCIPPFRSSLCDERKGGSTVVMINSPYRSSTGAGSFEHEQAVISPNYWL